MYPAQHRRVVRGSLVTVSVMAAAWLFALPTQAATPSSSAVRVTTQQTTAKALSADSAARIARHTVKPFRMVGVTWAAGSTATDVSVQVQVRIKGKWSSWRALKFDADDQAQEKGGRPGTIGLWLRSYADGVAVRASATNGTLKDLRATTIDPGKNPGSTVTAERAADKLTVASAGDGTPKVVPMPTIITRSQWGAAAGTACSSPTTATKALGVVVHHTADTNDYTKADSAAILRADQAYHIKGHGWCDLGYNFVVDKYGQIFEGRKGGITKQVRGAHAGLFDVNLYATGIAMIGNYDTTHVGPTLQAAMVRLVGWRLKYFGDNPKGTYTVDGKTYNVIGGHRDVKPTTCPGKYAYAWIYGSGGLRDRVAAYLSKATSAAGNTSPAKPGTVTGVSFSATDSSITASFGAVSGAASYRVWYKHGSGGAIAVKDFTSVPITLDSLGAANSEYRLKIAARSASGAWGRQTAWLTAYTSASASGSSSAANLYTVTSRRIVRVQGHGFGHGIGMSQYGAEGGALAGRSATQILAHYYPGTKLSTVSRTIRVLISADTSNSVEVLPSKNLAVRNLATGNKVGLPGALGGKRVTAWKIDLDDVNANRIAVYGRTASGWVVYHRMDGNAQFEDDSSEYLVLPSGSVKAYRGALRAVRVGTRSLDTVDVLGLDDYTRGVVASEMPASWAAAALQAQAVAARSYAAGLMDSSKAYDVCDTTACQVYGGVASETATSDAAVAATAGKVLTYGGSIAFTQFSSSSGGYTQAGSQPYLKAVSDPWDSWSGNPNSTWTVTLKAGSIEQAFPQIGTLGTVELTARNGLGASGGRVTQMVLNGSKKSITITGNAFRAALGLKSNWFAFPTSAS